jgi:hypothetical protein
MPNLFFSLQISEASIKTEDEKAQRMRNILVDAMILPFCQQ